LTIVSFDSIRLPLRFVSVYLTKLKPFELTGKIDFSAFHRLVARYLLLYSGMSGPKSKGLLVKPCDRNIQETIELSEKMILLADQGDADRVDPGCGILYGVMRDAAFQIKRLAEKEKLRHIRKGWWKTTPGSQ
jgi:hypothetical protein